MNMRTVSVFLTVALAISIPAGAQPGQCQPVGGVLMTNIGAITDGAINLGPVVGDLAGSVAAKIVSANSDGTFTVQHYWVTTAGDTILFKPAVLTPAYPVTQGFGGPNKAIVAVPWGNYSSEISGGTGRFDDATGTVAYFGMADFVKNTLVLRYAGTVCLKQRK
jgi:hypothetical protein